ncbi:MAG: prepilin-type N-terminal cleavage/methylation domain-containing protein [Kiritimatiellia bacterium]
MNTMRMNDKRAGFTLVEIMIVVIIIGLLALIAVPQLARNRDAAQRSACQNNLRQINGSTQQYMLENNTTTVPSSAATATMFQTGAFPTCPGGGTYTMPATDTSLPTCSLSATKGHTL